MQSSFALRLAPPAQALFPAGSAHDVQTEVRGEKTLIVATEAWHEIDLQWDCDEGVASASLGDQRVQLPQRHVGDGICYLRLRPIGGRGDGGVMLADVAVVIEADTP